MKWRHCGLSSTQTSSSKGVGPPLVDADCHAFCQAIYKIIGGEELYCNYRGMSKATGLPEGTRKGIMDGFRKLDGNRQQQGSGRGSLAQGLKAFFLSRSRISVNFVQRPPGKERMI